MSFTQKYFPQVQELHRDHLTRQWEHLRLIRNFHLQCMQKAQDPELCQRYRDIAVLLEQAIGQYEELLETLRSKDQELFWK
jgi:hypothetical protein